MKMKYSKFTLLAVLIVMLELYNVAKAQDMTKSKINDPLAQDTLPQAGVPKGETFTFVLENSKVFPGTIRTISVYVPVQYDGKKAACLYFGLDRLSPKMTTTFDNLIHKGEMPVTIAVGLPPGKVPTINGVNPRFNRSFEFDSMTDTLAQFVIEEVLPQLKQHSTPNGLPILISDNPNDRAVGGFSTGAIGAFTLAWQRPNSFRRVFSAIGTYVGMRGGDSYPVLVRKTEPKPIRIFMQDGSNDNLDNWIGEVGNWWHSNLNMENGLIFSGYEVEHVWGEGGHDFKHGLAVFPDAMRYLWKDWPVPVSVGTSKNTLLKGILIEGEGWVEVLGIDASSLQLAVSPSGDLYGRNNDGGATWLFRANGVLSIDDRTVKPSTASVFGADGRMYVASKNKIAVSVPGEKSRTLAKGISATKMIVTPSESIYAVEEGRLWLVTPGGDKKLLDDNLDHPAGIALSPDGLWLAVIERDSRRGYNYRLKEDGTLNFKQLFYWFHVPDDFLDHQAGPWVYDQNGLLYLATGLGIQVLDRNGRSRAILPLPGNSVATGLAFGGEDFEMLFVTAANGKLYKRRIKTAGAPAFMAPSELPKWGPG